MNLREPPQRKCSQGSGFAEVRRLRGSPIGTPTSAAAPSPVYRLRIRPVEPVRYGDDIRHLRALLKVMLRRFRFRCIEIEREPDVTPQFVKTENPAPIFRLNSPSLWLPRPARGSPKISRLRVRERRVRWSRDCLNDRPSRPARSPL
jgi:hypothetical protein